MISKETNKTKLRKTHKVIRDRWFVYLLKCADRTLYCGSTNNLERRLKEHNRGTAARYTRGRGPVALAYFESHRSLQSARQREQEIKGWAKEKKLTLIGGL